LGLVADGEIREVIKHLRIEVTRASSLGGDCGSKDNFGLGGKKLV